MADDFAGLVLNNRYEMGGLLGSGGMGLVYLSHDSFLDRQVAVKIIQPEEAWSEEATESFVAEARIIARLEHPHILKIYDLGNQVVNGYGEVLYLVLQLAAGGTLDERVEANPLSPSEVARILKPVCDGLDYAHSQGVIHLDLKPLNIFFDNLDNPLVADFGLARVLHDAAGELKADTRAGTLDYMPPEQLFGAVAGTFSDIYALGISIYEMLTSEMPRREWDGMAYFDHPIPPRLLPVIRKATQPNPRLRYAKARDLAQAFADAVAGKPVVVTGTDAKESVIGDDVNGHYDQGLVLFDEGDLEGAIEAYDAALQVEPDNAHIYFHRGMARSEMGDFDGAIADYDHAIYMDGDQEDFYFYRGYGRQVVGDMERAIADFNEVILRDSHNADAYYYRGLSYGKQGRLYQAIADFSEVIRLQPRHAGAFYLRGNARNKQGDLRGAVTDLSMAIMLNPQHADAYYLRGDAHYQQEEFAEAIGDFVEAIRLDPEHADAFYLRGLTYYQQADVEDAIADLDEAIRLNPDHAEAHYLRGHAYGKRGDLRAAVDDFGTAVRINPQDAEANFYRGLANVQREELEDAIADFIEAIRLSPQDAEAYGRLGDCYYDLKRYADALVSYRRYLELESEEPESAIRERVRLLERRLRKKSK